MPIPQWTLPTTKCEIYGTGKYGPVWEETWYTFPGENIDTCQKCVNRMTRCNLDTCNNKCCTVRLVSQERWYGITCAADTFVNWDTFQFEHFPPHIVYSMICVCFGRCSRQFGPLPHLWIWSRVINRFFNHATGQFGNKSKDIEYSMTRVECNFV